MEKRIYLPLQLKVLMQPEMYKTTDVLFAFQKEGVITYSKRNATFLRLDEAITDQVVQTLLNKKIIAPVGKENGYWKFRIVEDTLEKFRNLTWDEVSSGNIIKMADEITFKNEPSDETLSKLSDDDKTRLIERLLRELDKDKRKLIESDGLPF